MQLVKSAGLEFKHRIVFVNSDYEEQMVSSLVRVYGDVKLVSF